MSEETNSQAHNAQPPQSSSTSISDGETMMAVPENVPLPRPGSREAFDLRLRELYGSFTMTRITEDVFRKLLDDEEQKQWGPECKDAVQKLQSWNAAYLLEKVKGLSKDMATLEVAISQHFILSDEFFELRRHVEQKEGADYAGSKPTGTRSAMIEAVKQARSKHDLLIVTGELVQAIYWHGELCPTKWENHRTSWNFLYTLARARIRERLCETDDFGEDSTLHTISTRKYNLKRLKCVPTDLADCIVIKSNTAYLYLPKEKICILPVGRHLRGMDDLLY